MQKQSRELVMAKLYLKNKDYKLAEKSFLEYVSMSPNDVTALKLLAQVYEQIKRFDKAYEMYERCYLAEPERTGVLLDICRILLMNEIRLERVDYKRWLNLASKAFPSNPIVVNFKAFLSTSPSEEVQFREIPKVSIDDPIVEKLSSIERRLEKIELKLDNVTINNQPPVVNLGKEADKLAEKRLLESQNKLKEENKLAEKRLLELQDKLKDEQSKNRSLEERLRESQQATERKQEELLSMTRRLEESKNLEREDKKKLEEDIRLKQEEIARGKENVSVMKEKTPVMPTETALNLTSTILPNQQPSLFQSSFLFGTAAPPPTNLFADAIKKLNLPTEGSWAFGNSNGTQPLQAKQDDQGSDGEQEAEPEPENLPEENTCDMVPIAIRTGEEDEDVLFENRCKLYRLKDKEYKERGLGPIKVLRHKVTRKGRLLMRRELVGLVCLNCWDLRKVERVRDTQIKFWTIDAEDREGTFFLVKFKTPELTDTFMSHINALFSDDIELVEPKLDQELVEKARQLQLPDLFYHELKNQDKCSGCDGCEKDE